PSWHEPCCWLGDACSRTEPKQIQTERGLFASPPRIQLCGQGRDALAQAGSPSLRRSQSARPSERIACAATIPLLQEERRQLIQRVGALRIALHLLRIEGALHP